MASVVTNIQKKAETLDLLDLDDLFSLDSIKKTYDAKKYKYSNQRSGIDKVSVDIFEKNKIEHFRVIFNKCRCGTYKFSPYVEKLVSKGRNKTPRLISVPTIRDRIVLDLLKQYLNVKTNFILKNDLPNTYIKNLRQGIQELESTEYELHCSKFDIKNFYGTLNHLRLLKVLKSHEVDGKIIDLIKSAIETGTVNPSTHSRQNLILNEKGVPQGLAISNILAEIYINEIDNMFKDVDVKYFRYVDDILILHPSSVNDRLQEFIDSLQSIKLELSNDEGKFSSGPINEPFEFLGYYFRYPLIAPKTASQRRFINSIIKIFTEFKYRRKHYGKFNKDLNLIKKIFVEDLNEKISGSISGNKRYGWLFFFSQINHLKLIYQIDAIIQSQFEKLEEFDGVPDDLKKLSRSYYLIKHNNYLSYVHNYDSYPNVKDKIRYLKGRVFDPDKDNEEYEKAYSKEEIEFHFDKWRDRNLRSLDQDVGVTS